MGIGSRLERALGVLALASTAGASASSDAEQAFVAKETSLGASCVPSIADSSGIAGWYLAPVQIEPLNLASVTVIDAKIGGDSMAVLTEQRLYLYSLQSNGLPPIVEQTYQGSGSNARNLIVSPLGNEVAYVSGSAILFSRKISGVWSQPQFLTGRAIAYSPDGTEIAVSTIDGTVRIAERNAQGNWELGTTIQLAKPDSTFGSEVLWSQDRIVVSASSLLYSFRKVSSAYELSQVFLRPFEALRVQRFDNGLVATGNSYFFQYARNASGFIRGQQNFYPNFNASATVRGLSGQKIGGFGSQFLSGDCAPYPVFFVSNRANPGSNKLVLPDPVAATSIFDFDGRSAVMVTQGPAPSFAYRVYFTTRDRIFGGNAPEPGEDGVGPGGFESAAQ